MVSPWTPCSAWIRCSRRRESAISHGACKAAMIPNSNASQCAGVSHLTIAIRQNNVKASLRNSPSRKAATNACDDCRPARVSRRANSTLGTAQASPPSRMSRAPGAPQYRLPRAATTITSTICRLTVLSILPSPFEGRETPPLLLPDMPAHGLGRTALPDSHRGADTLACIHLRTNDEVAFPNAYTSIGGTTMPVKTTAHCAE